MTVPLAVAAGLVWLLMRRSWEGPWLLTIAIAGSTAARIVVKWLVARPRPALLPLVEATGSAFPSGHAMQAVVVYGALAVLTNRISQSRSARLTAWLAASGLTLLVAASRVLLGVHYGTDVIAGLAFGGAWLVVAANVGGARSEHGRETACGA